MAMEDIRKKILKDAESQKERILEDAGTKADETIESFLERAGTRGTELRTVAEKEREAIDRMIISTARSNASRAILEEKERHIDEAIVSALDHLRGLPEPEYLVLIRNLYMKGKELAGNNCIVMPCTDRDAAALTKSGIATGIAEKAGSTSSDTGNRSHISSPTTGTVNHTGGVVVRSIDGRIRVDNSFEAIVERKRLSLKVMISDILFPHGESK